MKKLVSLVLALVLALAMSLTVFAEPAKTQPVVIDLDETSSTTASVDVKVSGSENLNTVYSVDVTWESLDFTYNFGEADTWNPEDHSYTAGTTGTAGGWVDNASLITITNHSNATIRAKASFAGGASSLTRNDVTATISNPSFTVATAVGTPVESAPNGTFTCSVSGIPSVTTGFNVGTITISIEAAE